MIFEISLFLRVFKIRWSTLLLSLLSATWSIGWKKRDPGMTLPIKCSVLEGWNVFSLSPKLIFKQGILKCIWSKNYFWKVIKFTIWNTCTFLQSLKHWRGKSTIIHKSPKICVILPSKMAFELHGQNTTWQQQRRFILRSWKQFLSITLPYTYFRESVGKFEEKRHYEPLIIDIVTKLCFPIQMCRDISCKNFM